MSLADSFLADLEDIDGFEMEMSNSAMPTVAATESVVPVASILSDSKFNAFISGVESSLSPSSGSFALLAEASQYIPLLEGEIYTIYKIVAEIYSRRFPELEQIVLMPTDYLRVVDRLQSKTSLLTIDAAELADIVPANQAVAISVTASTSRGLSQLSEIDRLTVQARLKLALEIDSFKQRIVSFLTSQMPLFAPNLCALLGSLIAAQLVAAAGGLENLASMPSQNIEALGSHKQSLSGLSGSSAKTSLLSRCNLITNAPLDARKRAMRLVTGKASLCARVDRFGSDQAGETGSRLRAEIEQAIEKTTELPPARAVKPLALPEIEKPDKSRRGGRRARAWKAKYGPTEIQKRAGRIQFGKGEGDLDIEGTVQASSKIEMEAGRIRAIKPTR